MMGVETLSAQVIYDKYDEAIRVRGGFTFAVFKELIQDMAKEFRNQEGKFYSLLSLQEAEHFRSVLHARQKQSLINDELLASTPSTAALWVLHEYDMHLLGTSYLYKSGNPSQHSSMVNSYRYLNSETYYTNNNLTVLLRILENDPIEIREKWWSEIRACRRRRQISIDGTFPLLTVFNTKNEFDFMEFKAVVNRVQIELNDVGMLIYDAFRAFNSSNSGAMTCSELYGGLDFLGMKRDRSID